MAFALQAMRSTVEGVTGPQAVHLVPGLRFIQYPLRDLMSMRQALNELGLSPE